MKTVYKIDEFGRVDQILLHKVHSEKLEIMGPKIRLKFVIFFAENESIAISTTKIKNIA